ncbi:MAG: dihydropteroate synthase [Actinomycetaceae bacterium]|nr:dihydropteroate synthase [Actinomycetaceae bacterium]
MGILNVTPDSFSDGGKHYSLDAAYGGALRMVDEGADIIDIGGESTRPGATPISAEEEWNRIGGLIGRLSNRDVVVSVDTYHAETARRAALEGAHIINDVTGGYGDKAMLGVVAENDCVYVLQHSRGQSAEETTYGDIGQDVADELSQALERAVEAGIDRERIILDPGFGFAKDSEQCWDLVGRLEPTYALGRPVLVGVSRKRFIGDISPAPDGVGAQKLGENPRDVASAVMAFHFACGGAWAIRAHNVPATVCAIRAAEHLR